MKHGISQGRESSMSIKTLIENIKSKGLLQAMGLLEQLYQTAIENEEKLAESESKCAALAAEKERFAVECAATKIAIAYLKSGRQDFTLNTPATDAFLAEVRAQHSESICVSLLEKAGEYEARAKEIDCYTTDNRYRFAAAMFRGFAAQLRQGVAQ